MPESPPDLPEADLRLAVRNMRQYPEPWAAEGCQIAANGRVLLTAPSRELASLIAATHNVVLPLFNRLILAERKIEDLRLVRAEREEARDARG